MVVIVNNTILYICREKVLKILIIKKSLTVCSDEGLLDLLWWPFYNMYKHQIIMLCSWKYYIVICQPRLSWKKDDHHGQGTRRVRLQARLWGCKDGHGLWASAGRWKCEQYHTGSSWGSEEQHWPSLPGEGDTWAVPKSSSVLGLDVGWVFWTEGTEQDAAWSVQGTQVRYCWDRSTSRGYWTMNLTRWVGTCG